MKVLVLGCGEMAVEAINDLYFFGDFKSIAVGTRSLKRAKRVLAELKGGKAEVSAIRIAVGENHDELVALMRRFDVVVNCIGPNYKYEVPIARAAISARVNLVDINDDYETTLEMLEIDQQAKEAEISIILGLGASPGVNNILARAASDRLDGVDEIHTAWVMSGADPGGVALSCHLIHSLSDKALTFRDGRMVTVSSFVDGMERMAFPEPVGTVDVYHVGHPEPITLSRSFKNAKYVDDKATFVPAWINNLIVDLGKLVREAPPKIQMGNRRIDPMEFASWYLNQRCKGLTNVSKEGALRVEVSGKKNGIEKKFIISSAGRIAQATGISASVGAIMMAQGDVKKKGVLPPETCIDPDAFLFELTEVRHVGHVHMWTE